MSSSPTSGDGSSSYIFNRDQKSSIRLNYQHWLIKQLCNVQLLHPTISSSVLASSSSCRIADIATGTAIWPIELSTALSSASCIDGFDVSAAQYPPAAWLPPSVHLHVHDAFTPFPPEYLGAYDVVHIRFFITLLSAHNITALMENLAALLKPGGYLQWLDLDPLSARAASIDPSTPTPGTQSVAALMRKPRPDADYSWLPHDCTTLTSAGLEAVAYERIPVVDRYRAFWNQSHLMGVEEVCARIEGSDQGGEKARAAREMLAKLGEEFARGASIDTEYFLMVGRKPA